MKDIYYYQPAKPADLSSALAKVFDDMGADGNRYIKSATVNTILGTEVGYNKKEMEDLIDSLTLVHPNRAFLIVIDESAKEIQTEFSTRCHKISKTEHVCSEVIRLVSSSRMFSEVKSIIRANLITGMHTELVLSGSKEAQIVFKNFEQLCDQTIFSSSIFENDFSALKALMDSKQQLIDLEWVRLGVWRDEVKSAFNHAPAKEKLAELKKVEIHYRDGTASAFLIAGWLANRLGLSIKGREGLVLKFTTKESKEFTIELKGNPGLRNAGINQLNFIFENSSEYIKVSSVDNLQTEINFREILRTTKPLEELDFIGLMKQYFFIGESLINYRDSLALAVKLHSLTLNL